MSATSPPIGARRLERAAIFGVMSRDIANFRTFWKATTFSSVLEPISRVRGGRTSPAVA